MAPSTKLLAALALVTLNVACSTARDPAKGFRLAGTGDIGRGKAAFLEFECNRCHDVAGANLPRQAIQPIALGGAVIHQPSDGYLVTAIINPAFHAALYPIAGRPSEGVSPMPYYAQRMTVQQLTDIVCYLQTRYSLSPMPVKSEFP
jgi:sulfur-oxidizing protein SoxX